MHRTQETWDPFLQNKCFIDWKHSRDTSLFCELTLEVSVLWVFCSWSSSRGGLEAQTLPWVVSGRLVLWVLEAPCRRRSSPSRLVSCARRLDRECFSSSTCRKQGTSPLSLTSSHSFQCYCRTWELQTLTTTVMHDYQNYIKSIMSLCIGGVSRDLRMPNTMEQSSHPPLQYQEVLPQWSFQSKTHFLKVKNG